MALGSLTPDSAAAIAFGSEDGEHDLASRKGKQDAFDSIGRIQCPDPGSPRNWLYTTGWLIGDNQTVITAAHGFYGDAHPARRLKPRPLDPRTCTFMLYDRAQKLRGKFAIRYAISPWAERRRRYDISYDVAIARLSRPVDGAVVPVVRPTRSLAGTTTSLLAYRSTDGESQLLHQSSGLVEAFSLDSERLALARRFGLRISYPELLLVTSASTMQGSSGGMYYSSEWRAAIGIHLGYLCASSAAAVSFNTHSCFNYGRLMSHRVLRWVAGVNADKPHLPYMIRAGVK